MTRKLLLTVVVVILLIPTVQAFPNLQLYVNGGTFDPVTETWISMGGDAEVWVVADVYDGNTRVDLYDITLVAVLGKNTDQSDVDAGTLSISKVGSMTPETLEQWRYGTPPPDQNPSIGGHGFYPGMYTQLTVAESTVGVAANDDIYNFNENFYNDPFNTPSEKGILYKYMVSTTYQSLHLDAYGFLDPFGDKQDRTVAPFSHDAEIVPEPTSMLLIGLGLAGAGIVRRVRNK